MEISKFTSYFHDGEILDIKQMGNNIEIFMRSAEIDPDDIKDNSFLSKGNIIRGKLHIQGIKTIKLNDKPFHGFITKLRDDNDLLHLKILNNTVFIEIGWKGSCTIPDDFSAIEFEAKKIWWENLPDVS